MGSRDSTVTDAQLRAAEGRLLEHLGLTATERMITVPAGRTGGPAGRGGPGEVAVRLLELGPGDGSPPVLFLHGIASASAAAFPLMRALSGRRVLALDWPGHGLSGECVLPANTDIRQHVRAVLGGVLAELGVSAVDLVGHSLGGHFGLFFTIAEPGAVRRLVLLGAPGGAFPQMRPVAAMRALAVPGAGGSTGARRRSPSAGACWTAGLPTWPRPVTWRPGGRDSRRASRASFAAWRPRLASGRA
jgi:pimeloyl-ACP methyl ester carboxylesterase